MHTNKHQHNNYYVLYFVHSQAYVRCAHFTLLNKSIVEIVELWGEQNKLGEKSHYNKNELAGNKACIQIMQRNLAGAAME